MLAYLLSSRVSNQETTETIRKYYHEYFDEASYVLDPHTAVGVKAAENVVSDDSLVVCVLGTASPGKIEFDYFFIMLVIFSWQESSLMPY